MSLYTGKGDTGTSGVFGSKERSSKNSPRYRALGGIDELNSLIGFCRANATANQEIHDWLLDVQEKLFIVQAELAAASPEKLTIKSLPPEATQDLEKIIDGLEPKIGPITKFSIPGGHPLSALLDYARAVCRRVEKDVVAYHDPQPVNPAILSYINRLSSLFFALARWVNKKSGIEEKHPRY